MRNRIIDPFKKGPGKRRPAVPAGGTTRASANDWLHVFTGALAFALAGAGIGGLFGLLLSAARALPWLPVIILLTATGALTTYFSRRWWAGAAAGTGSGLLMLVWPALLPVFGGLVGAGTAAIPALLAWQSLDTGDNPARRPSAPVLIIVLAAAGWFSALALQRAAPLYAMLWMALVGLGCGLLAGLVSAAEKRQLGLADRENALFSGAAVVIVASWLAITNISSAAGPLAIDTSTTIESYAYPSGMTQMHFTSNRHGSRQIYRQDVRTGQTIRLTEPARGECWMARAGSEGDLYVTCNRDGSPQVYRQNPSTGVFDRMTQGAQGSCWEPALGPNNNTYFTCDRDGKRAIYYQERETGKVVRMTDPTTGESWSPALGPGGELYFTSDRGGSWQIYRLSLDDGSAIRMTEPTRGDCWSPALGFGDDMYVTCNRDGSRQIYRIDHRTGAVVRMTQPGSGESWGAVLGPNGNIHFTSDRSGKREVYRIDHNTGEVTRMTNTDSGESWTLDEE